MVNPTVQSMAFPAVIGGIGLILLGMGVGGLASLPAAVESQYGGGMMGPAMGQQMMSMMMGPAMGSMMMGGGGGPQGMGMFASNPGYWIDVHAGIMTGIYLGLIIAGSYLIYRVVAPLVRVSTVTTTK